MSPTFYLALIGMMVAFANAAASRKGPTVGWPPAAWATLALGGYGTVTGDVISLRLAVVCATLGLVGPSLLFALARAAAGRGEFGTAARIVGWLATLRRAQQMYRWRDLWAAADAWHQGDRGPADALRARLAAGSDPAADTLREALAILTRDWERARFAHTVDARARALCELGELDAGIETIGPVMHQKLTWSGLRRARLLWLAPLAFAGRVRAVEALCQLLRLRPHLTGIWLGTALSAAGRSDEARTILERLRKSVRLPIALRNAVEQRLADPPTPQPIGPSAEGILATAEQEIRAGLCLRDRPWWRDPASLAILGAILAGFVIQEVRGGSLDPTVAWRLGALVGGQFPNDPLDLLSYGFLHFGPMHLIVNALAIAVLAPMVGASLGRLGLLVVYLGAVLGGGVGIAVFGTEGLTVGASGGAMGLLGAILIVLWRHPALHGTTTGNAGARFAAGVVIFQSAFDVLIAEISFAGHAAGLVSGGLLTLCWILFVVRR